MIKKVDQAKLDQKVRGEIASDLKKFANVLQNTFGRTFALSPITSAIEEVKTYGEEGRWGYSVENLIIPTKITRHLCPSNLKKCELSVSAQVKGSTKNWDEKGLVERLDDSNFNATLRAENYKKPNVTFEYKVGFHIDKLRDSDGSEEMHPLYHVHYFNESGIEGDNNMRAFNLDSPRLAHHPVDFILGTILVIANFNKQKYDEICENGLCKGLCLEYANKIIRPYYKSISDIFGDKDDEFKSPIKENTYLPYLSL
ncbi:hypothetical protein ACTNDU_09385 [Hallella faecis]|uniref:hypothetical protein n=1 Tax=Hallella faecis TaxID=2841596 RepID=UPI003F8A9F91